MTQRDWILLISTFLMGAVTGGYLYTMSFKPLYDGGGDIQGGEESAETFSVTGRPYGGHTLPNYVYPSFRIGEDGSYEYLAGGVGEEVDAEPIEGTLPKALFADLKVMIEASDLGALSSRSGKESCNTYVDGADYVYGITIDGERTTIDTCESAITYDDPLYLELENVWEYFRNPEEYVPSTEADDSDESFMLRFLRKNFDVSYEEEPVACTMEAKICPDGSAVGRTGPRCEFAACPGE